MLRIGAELDGALFHRARRAGGAVAPVGEGAREGGCVADGWKARDFAGDGRAVVRDGRATAERLVVGEGVGDGG